MEKNAARMNLLDIDQLCRENNIEYCLFCGTLLGLHRENKILDHDEDLDICIDSIFLNKKFINLLFDFSYEIISIFGHVDDGFSIKAKKHETELDILFLYKNKKDYWYHSVYGDFTNTTCEKKDYLFSPFYLQEKEFLEHNFYVPSNIDQIIFELYGENWQIPDKNWDYFSQGVSTNQTIYNVDTNNQFYKLLLG